MILPIYGIKGPTKIDRNTILKYAVRYNIPSTDCYELDTSFRSFLLSLDTSFYKIQIKNHSQPLQALYYGKEGHLESFHVNCYTGGFPNLNWNKNQVFSIFPPGQQAPLDSLLQLNVHMKYLKQLDKSGSESVDSYDKVILVYWNTFMGRQAIRLIHAIQKNVKLAGDKKTKTIYVNNDNYFSILY